MRAYPAVFNLGFRIFFLSASVFSVITMMLWLFAFSLSLPMNMGDLPLIYWHGHEMVFGYSMAVVAGFLLTAVQNWTGVAMPSGRRLFIIWLPWLLARLIYAIYPSWHILAEVGDIIFTGLLFYAVGYAVISVKQWRQMGILSKIGLMLIANILYLCGSLGWMSLGQYWGLYIGVFILLSLVLTIGRRVIPFFIERGVGYPVTLKNSPLKDRLSLISFLLFFIVEVFTTWQTLAGVLALVAAIIQAWRLVGWYTPGIWKKPLLWSLYLAMVAVIIGLGLYFLQLFLPISGSLAMHGLAVGGIGIITLSMIGRVSLGHTGRNIHQPSKWLIVALVLIFITFLFRVLMPVIWPSQYMVWIIHGQILWIVAFLCLVIANMRIWLTPRPDGRAG